MENDPIFQPLEFRNLTVKNRVILLIVAWAVWQFAHERAAHDADAAGHFNETASLPGSGGSASTSGG